MTPAILQQLERAAKCSDDMLECARTSRWDELLELVTERTDLLSGYRNMSRDHGRGDHQLEARLLSRIIDSNDRIIELSESRRRQLAESLSTSRLQREAAGAYSSSRNKPSA